MKKDGNLFGERSLPELPTAPKEDAEIIRSGNAIEKVEPNPVVPLTPMELLSATDLATLDVDKMEKLMELEDRWAQREAVKAFNAAVTGFQMECPIIKKNARNKGTNSNYATYECIIRQIRGLLKKHKLAVRFSTHESHLEGHVKGECIVMHVKGHAVSTFGDFPEQPKIVGKSSGKEVMNDLQRAGSRLTYLKRYLIMAALNITVADEDDDGFMAGEKTPTLNEYQLTELKDLLKRKGLEDDEYVRNEYLQVPFGMLDTIHANRYEWVMNSIRAHSRRES